MKDNSKLVLLPLIIIILVLILGLLPKLLWIKWNPMISWQDVTNYLSWPILIIMFVVILFYIYEKQIAELIKYFKFKTPSGYEFCSQRPTEEINHTTIDTLIKHLSHQDQDIKESEVILYKQLHIEALNEAIMWRFKYANIFLAPPTKNLLLWFSSVESVRHQDFHIIWQHIAPAELEAEMYALLSLNFVADNNLGSYSITDYGRAFLGLPLKGK